MMHNCYILCIIVLTLAVGSSAESSILHNIYRVKAIHTCNIGPAGEPEQEACGKPRDFPHTPNKCNALFHHSIESARI